MRALARTATSQTLVLHLAAPPARTGLLRLDIDQNWAEIAELIEDSYRLIAQKRLAALLDQRPTTPGDNHP
jgi:hypothetical protein